MWELELFHVIISNAYLWYRLCIDRFGKNGYIYVPENGVKGWTVH